MKFLQKYIHLFSYSVIIFAFIFLHAYQITETPAGLYLDETSIGLNAATIATSGVDEYGESFPVYFKAFGEWKNPLYIYAASGSFLIFGISEWSLRITSVFFFGIFLLGLVFFTQKLFPQKKSVIYYVLISAGTLPWFFTLSRISFEVISQISMGIWLFYFLYISYNIERNNRDLFFVNIIYPLLSGVFLALFLYSYSTSRVIAFGVIMALLLSFYQKKYWKTHFFLISSFIFCILPYIYFSYDNPGALTARFEILTYLYNNNLSILEKASILLQNYFSAFDLSSFLLFQGDVNIRHAAGFMGQLFFIPFVLFIIGIAGVIQKIFHSDPDFYKNNKFSKQWLIFLMLIFLGSPLSASLTTDIHHSLRLLFFGLMIFIFSIYGYFFVLERYNQYKEIIMIFIFSGIFLQSFFYFQYYFSDEMKNKTISAFGGYELQDVIEWAKDQNASQIVFYENSRDPLYASINFYNHIVGTDVVMSKKPMQKNICQIWYKWNAPVQKLSPRKVFTGSANGIISGGCY